MSLRSAAMPSFPWPHILSNFNALVLDHQEQAFTLACWLLGDENRAALAVQMGVADAFRQWDGRGGATFTAHLLCAVAHACRISAGPRSGCAAIEALPAETRQRLASLPFEQRLALALVDGLDLSYALAAEVLRCSTGRINRILASARRSLIAETAPTVEARP